jgi:hypothetical protein
MRIFPVNGDSVHDFLRRLEVPITRRTLSVHGNQFGCCFVSGDYRADRAYIF